MPLPAGSKRAGRPVTCPNTFRLLLDAPNRETAKRTQMDGDRALGNGRRKRVWVLVLGGLFLGAAGLWPVDAKAAQLRVTWINNAGNANGFAVERSTGAGGSFAQIAVLGAGTVSYVDAGLAGGVVYCYRVRAFNGAGFSQYSNVGCATAQVVGVVAALLPSSRSVQVGTTATAFATILNVGPDVATACGIGDSSVLATFSYQALDPATNEPIGTPNTPADIPAGQGQSYVIVLTPTAPIAPTEVLLDFTCSNTAPAPIISGLNTLLLSASANPVPDIVALAATFNNDGIVNIPGASGTGVFAVATVNVGTGASITASADTGSASLPVSIAVCQTNPTTGVCLGAPTGRVTTQINAGQTPAFGIFVNGSGTVPFDPANNRVFVRFTDAGGATRGSTSAAVRTE